MAIKKSYYERNRVIILEKKKAYYQANREKKLEEATEYRNRPDESKRRVKYAKQWREDNPNYVAPNRKESKAKYRATEKGKAKEKSYRESRVEKDKELKKIRMADPEYASKNKEWHRNHRKKPEVVSRRRELDNIRSKKDSIKKSLRTLLYNSLNRFSQDGKIYGSRKYGISYRKCIEKLKADAKNIGYTIRELRQMKFHIDHKIPISAYNLNDMDDIKNCFNPINLQWLPQTENIVKGNKIFRDLIITLPTEIYPKSWGGVIPIQ